MLAPGADKAPPNVTTPTYRITRPPRERWQAYVYLATQAAQAPQMFIALSLNTITEAMIRKYAAHRIFSVIFCFIIFIHGKHSFQQRTLRRPKSSPGAVYSRPRQNAHHSAVACGVASAPDAGGDRTFTAAGHAPPAGTADVIRLLGNRDGRSSPRCWCMYRLYTMPTGKHRSACMAAPRPQNPVTTRPAVVACWNVL